MSVWGYFENLSSGELLNNGRIYAQEAQSYTSSGLLAGGGTHYGNLSIVDAGIIQPGNEFAKMNCYGDYTQTSESTYVLTIQDHQRLQSQDNEPQYNQLYAQTAYLSGTLEVTVQPDYQITGSEEIVFFSYNTRVDSFEQVILPDISPYEFELIYHPSHAVLRVQLPGYVNHGLDFDGVDDYIFVDGSTTWLRAIEFKFFPQKTDITQEGDPIFSSSFHTDEWIKTMDAVDEIDGETLTIRNGGTGLDNILYTDYPFEQKWYHISIVGDYAFSNPKYNQIYVNGQPVDTYSGSSAPNTFFSSSYLLGKVWNENDYYEGKLDEVRLWINRRFPSQIEQYYQKEMIGTESGLAIYYDMNHGRANGDNIHTLVTADRTTFRRSGYLHNFALTGNSSNWVQSPCCLIVNQHSFVGTTNTDWMEATNWSTGTVPGACDEVQITDNQTVDIHPSQSAECLTLTTGDNSMLNIALGASFYANGCYH